MCKVCSINGEKENSCEPTTLKFKMSTHLQKHSGIVECKSQDMNLCVLV
jgi:hypothetical protein